jgi:hypothetical protein
MVDKTIIVFIISLIIFLITYVSYILRYKSIKFLGYFIFRMVYYVICVLCILFYTIIFNQLENNNSYKPHIIIIFIIIVLMPCVLYALNYIDNKYASKYFSQSTDIYYSYYMAFVCAIAILFCIYLIFMKEVNNIKVVLFGLFIIVSISISMIMLYKKYYGQHNDDLELDKKLSYNNKLVPMLILPISIGLFLFIYNQKDEYSEL